MMRAHWLRIDAIVDLDAQRRDTRTHIETAQAARNKLNRAMGKLRGNKHHVGSRKSEPRRNWRQQPSAAEEYDRASRLMDGTEPSHP